MAQCEYDKAGDCGRARWCHEWAELRAEIERLRELVKDAYHEGCMMNDEDWINSDARASLDSTKRWKGA